MEALREAPLGPGDAVARRLHVCSLAACVCVSSTLNSSQRQVTGAYRRAECVFLLRCVCVCVSEADAAF